MIRKLVCIVLATVIAGQAWAQSVTAILEASQAAQIKTTVNGQIENLLVTEGSAIQLGTELARIDADVQRARVAFAKVAAEGKGAIERAETTVLQARNLLERVTAARQKGAAQKWEVLQSEHAVALAEADLDIAREAKQQAEAQLALETATLMEFVIQAPFPATVLEIFKEVGETVDTQTVLMELGRLDTLTATAFVPVDWLDVVSVGDQLSATLDNNEQQSVEVTLKTIDPRIDPASRTIRIKLVLDNSEGAFLVGTGMVIEKP